LSLWLGLWNCLDGSTLSFTILVNSISKKELKIPTSCDYRYFDEVAVHMFYSTSRIPSYLLVFLLLHILIWFIVYLYCKYSGKVDEYYLLELTLLPISYFLCGKLVIFHQRMVTKDLPLLKLHTCIDYFPPERNG
jgi:hypothetical protein